MTLTPEDIKQINKAGSSKKGEIYHVLTKGGLNLIVQKSEGGEYRVLGQGAHRSFARNQAEAVEKIEWDQSLWKNEDLQKDDWIGEKHHHPTTGKLMGTPQFKDGQLHSIHYTPEEAGHIKESMKLKGLNPDTGRAMVESTPQRHYDLAAHHSKMAGKIAQHEKSLPMDSSTNDKHNAQMQQLMHTDIALKHYQASGLNRNDASREHKKHMALHHEIANDAQAPHHDFDLQLAWQRANPSKRFPSGLGNWTE